MITICAATEMEIAPAMEQARREKLPVQTLITGVGMMQAAFAISQHLITEKPAIIIQAGVAGSLTQGLSSGTFVVSSDCMGDAGVEEAGEFRSVFAMGLEKDEHPWTAQSLVNPNKDLLTLTGLRQVKAVTVNEVSTAEKRIDYYRASLGAEIESMEGAALHYCCIKLNQPFIQLRGISNMIGERDRSKWTMQEAIENMNTELIRIIQLL
jgi:futalosine hydrolase